MLKLWIRFLWLLKLAFFALKIFFTFFYLFLFRINCFLVYAWFLMGFSLFVLLFLFTLNFIWAWKIKLISLWNFLFLFHSFAFLLQLFTLHLDLALNILKWWGFLIFFVFWWNLFEINFWLLYCLFFINFCARFNRAKVLSKRYLVIGFLFFY